MTLFHVPECHHSPPHPIKSQLQRHPPPIPRRRYTFFCNSAILHSRDRLGMNFKKSTYRWPVGQGLSTASPTLAHASNADYSHRAHQPLRRLLAFVLHLSPHSGLCCFLPTTSLGRARLLVWAFKSDPLAYSCHSSASPTLFVSLASPHSLHCPPGLLQARCSPRPRPWSSSVRYSYLRVLHVMESSMTLLSAHIQFLVRASSY